jgi:hypothetical protein
MNADLFQWCMEKPFYERTNAELLEFVSDQQDNHVHRAFRVTAYSVILSRLGDGRASMPYELWTLVMGDIPPPSSHGMGMFPLYSDPKLFYGKPH